jgi:hypothetical protein
MTSKKFVEQLDFDFLETYSLLRRNTTDEKYANVYRGTIQSLIDTGLPHPTAEKTNTLKKEDLRTQELMNLLSIEFKEQFDWMCAPIFREMVVFYDTEKRIVSVLNICLSCDRVEDGNGNDVRTDAKVFAKLKEYFKNLGHNLERD